MIGRLLPSAPQNVRLGVRREAIKMMVSVTKGLRNGRQPSKSMANFQLFRHTHAAVELNRLLTDVTAGIGDFDLCS